MTAPGDITTPLCELSGHRSRIIAMAFHPSVEGVLLSGAGNNELKVWDLNQQSELFAAPGTILSLRGARTRTALHIPIASLCFMLCSLGCVCEEPRGCRCPSTHHREGWKGGTVQGVEWEEGGSLVCTSSKDKTLRVFDLRTSQEPVISIPSHAGSKGFYATFISHDRIVTLGFSKASYAYVETTLCYSRGTE